MLRSIIAIVVGVVVATAVIFVSEQIGRRLFPAPAIGVDMSDPEAWKDQETAAAYMSAVPFQAKAAVVIGWFLGTLAGGIAALMIGARSAPLAWIVAATIFLFSVSNFLAFPHPLWMIAGAPLAGGAVAIAAMRGTYVRPRTSKPL